MQASLIYVLALISVVAALCSWRLFQILILQARERLFPIFVKWTFYTLIWPRLNGSSDLSVASTAFILALLAANGASSIIGVQDRAQLSIRLARLCIGNLMFVGVGGRASVVLDRALRLPMNEHTLMHRWIGRISLVEGLLHGALHMLEHAKLQAIELSLLISSGILFFFSILFIRRRAYEIFLKLHSLASLTILISLWLHKRSTPYVIATLAIGSGLFFLEKVLSCLLLLYRNLGSGPSCRASFKHYEGHVVRVEITPKRAWISKSGQFLYLCLPRLRVLGIFESHPFMIAWDYPDSEPSRIKKVVLLAQASNGFTKKLSRGQNNSVSIISGPYGNNLHSFKDYDTVLFMANGIGIAGLLLSIRHLIIAHNDQTARVRRITLNWLLESKHQLEWAEEFLLALHDLDSKRRILNITLFIPDGSEGSAEGSTHQVGQLASRIGIDHGIMEMGTIIWAEKRAEAGNIVVSVCGSPQFELCVRQAIRTLPFNVSLKSNVFSPDETWASRSVGRYNAVTRKPLDATDEILPDGKAL